MASSSYRPLPELTREIPQERIDAYADVAGDHNPIHVDPVYAAQGQFGTTIAHGMLLFGLLSDVMTRAYGEAWASNGRMRARFRSPARPGDVVVIKGTIRAVDDEPDGRKLVRCSLECRTQDGQVVAAGDAQVIVGPETRL